jgi:hypothetical protein
VVNKLRVNDVDDWKVFFLREVREDRETLAATSFGREGESWKMALFQANQMPHKQ